MTLQRKYTLIWLLLPLLALRGLVPTGFMLDTAGGSLSMTICSGGVYKTVTVDQQGEHAPGEHQQQQHGDSICPFAAAAAGAPAPSVLSMLLGGNASVVIVSDVVEFHASFGPSRAQQSRAPPYFS